MGRNTEICIFHDIERGIGHYDTDPDFGKRADRLAPGFLERMLAIEKKLGVEATYNIVGLLLEELRPLISGRCTGFHSFDHDVEDSLENGLRQLRLCRSLCSTISGYRPPQSRIITGLDTGALERWHFKWLASSARSLGIQEPTLDGRIVHIPILIDDFPLFKGEVSFAGWKEQALDLADRYDFLAIGLHDCYAEWWLEDYEAFLADIAARGELTTFCACSERIRRGERRC